MQNQATVSVAMLERSMVVLQQMANEMPGELTAVQGSLVREANYLAATIATILRAKVGPQQFSGSEVGQYTADPTKSQFI